MIRISVLLAPLVVLVLPLSVAAEPAACVTSKDCDGCGVCSGSDGARRCVEPGGYECLTSEDCDHYELCDLYRDDKPACGGICRDWGEPCTSDADCPECSICVQGAESRQCRGFGVAECVQDEDCGAGEICDPLRDNHPQCGGTCRAEDEQDKTRTEVTGFSCGAAGQGGFSFALLLLAALGLRRCSPLR